MEIIKDLPDVFEEFAEQRMNSRINYKSWISPEFNV